MSYRLLIVEDSPELLEAVSDFYREEGAGLWEVVTASEGNDALARVTTESFDLMILDIMLPGASGFDICRAARKRSDCPIIFVTALGSEDSILKGYETGCDDYVVKPFSTRHLYAKSLALLKRATKNSGSEEIRCGSITLNKKSMLVTVNLQSYVFEPMNPNNQGDGDRNQSGRFSGHQFLPSHGDSQQDRGYRYRSVLHPRDPEMMWMSVW